MKPGIKVGHKNILFFPSSFYFPSLVNVLLIAKFAHADDVLHRLALHEGPEFATFHVNGIWDDLQQPLGEVNGI